MVGLAVAIRGGRSVKTGMTRSERLRRAEEIRAAGERMEIAARIVWRLRRTRLLLERAQASCAQGNVDETIDLAIAAFEQLPSQILPLLRTKIVRAVSRK